MNLTKEKNYLIADLKKVHLPLAILISQPKKRTPHYWLGSFPDSIILFVCFQPNSLVSFMDDEWVCFR